MRLYIAVLDTVPDFMVPTLVAHTILGAHLEFSKPQPIMTFGVTYYEEWLNTSFRKCVVRVNRKEFEKICKLDPKPYLGHENTTLDGEKSCAIPYPVPNDQLPNVLKYAKLWKPKDLFKESFESERSFRHTYSQTMREFLVDDGVCCVKCHGSGYYTYPTTSTFRHGIGGMKMTTDVCDKCWGSGNKDKVWPRHT